MTSTSIKLAKDQAEIAACYRVMHQLRPHLTSETFIDQVNSQIQQGYHLAYLQDGDQVKALAGYRFLEFLAWGKVVYIDDLVADAEARKKGYGGEILKWVIDKARQAGYVQVHLDSGPQRHDAHRLYLNHGFRIIGHHFALELS